MPCPNEVPVLSLWFLSFWFLWFEMGHRVLPDEEPWQVNAESLRCLFVMVTAGQTDFNYPRHLLWEGLSTLHPSSVVIVLPAGEEETTGRYESEDRVGISRPGSHGKRRDKERNSLDVECAG